MQRKYEIPKLDDFLRREYPDDPPWKAFFTMWLDARGYLYSSSESGIVDGARDAGIDAIAFAPHEHKHLKPVVVQSKYLYGRVPSTGLKRFLSTVRLFRSGNSANFQKWLDSHVRESLKTKYQKLWSNRKQVRFVLVTQGRLDKQTLKELNKLDVELADKNKIKSLLRDMAEGKTPRPESIILGCSRKPLKILTNSEHNLHILAAKVLDLAKAYGKYEDHLFAGNVRLALEGNSSSGVKAGLRETLEKSPDEFAYYHNGITIVCRRIIYGRGRVKIISPSIVNGAQTVSYVGRTMRQNVSPSASVLVKIVEVTDEEKFTRFETDIAISSNTQNKVSLSDLSVVNPDLVSLERFFASCHWFLQRKKGKFPAGNKKGQIKRDELLQCMASIDSKTGPSYSKDVQNLYKYHSTRLFSEYSDSPEHKRNALFLAQLNSLLKKAITNHKGQRKKVSKKIGLAKYATLAVFCTLLQGSGKWNRVRRILFEEGIKNSSTSLVLDKEFRLVLRKVLSYARKNAKQSELTTFFKNRDSIRLMEKKIIPGLKRVSNLARITG